MRRAMEREFASYLIHRLLAGRFESEEEMARQLGVSARELADAGALRCSEKAAVRVTSHILRYCIQQNVPLDTFSCPIIFS